MGRNDFGASVEVGLVKKTDPSLGIFFDDDLMAPFDQLVGSRREKRDMEFLFFDFLGDADDDEGNYRADGELGSRLGISLFLATTGGQGDQTSPRNKRKYRWLWDR